MSGDSKLVRVGVLGCSDIACRRFLPALLKSANAELVAVGSRDRYRAQERLGAIRTEVTGYESLLQRHDIDLLYISLPNHLHESAVIDALSSGKHVLCEKPLGLDAAAVARMQQAADRAGRLLYENLMYLHHPQHARVRELLTSGELGEVRSLRAVFTIPDLPPGNFRNDPACGGGAFHDLGRYPLSAARTFLSGDEYVFQGKSISHGGLITALRGSAANDRKELFHFSIGFGLPYRCYYKIITERGSILVDRAFTTPPDLANRIEVLCAGRDASFTVPPADHFLLTLEHVCRHLAQPELFFAVHQRNLRLANLADALLQGCHHG